MMRISVAGLGYVGLSNAVLLAEHHTVTALDTQLRVVESVNRNVSPIVDPLLSDYLATRDLDLTATTDPGIAYAKSDLVMICTPTDYDTDLNCFDTTSVESVLAMVAELAPHATVVIKSTLPVGHTAKLQSKYPAMTILFSPEFLREGQALHDLLHPSRIVVGGDLAPARRFGTLLSDAAMDTATPVLVTSAAEAEAIKLFANTYLAMRVSFFNELDTYAQVHGLNSRAVIEGIGHDPRIGTHYNNPSFGYGGYCLPKDTKQLLANYQYVPQTLIGAIVASNAVRKDFLSGEIVRLGARIVGIYRLVMKEGSDNFRGSSIFGVIQCLQAAGVQVIVYEPTVQSDELSGVEVSHDLETFLERVDLVVANRRSNELRGVEHKLYTRDIFSRD